MSRAAGCAYSGAMRKVIVGPVVGVLLLIAPRVSDGQIVDVQSAFSELQEEGLSASFDISADWRTGNVSFLALGSRGNVQYGASAHQLMFSARGEITPTERIRDGIGSFEHLRYRYWFSERWAAESFVQHEYDPSKRLSLRLLLGAGGRWVAVNGENAALSLGVALMGERIRLREGAYADSGEVGDVLRISSYVMGRVAIGDSATLSQTFYAQPRVDAPGDYRLLSESGLMVPVTERVALNLSFVVSGQSRPPEGVVPIDTRLLNRLLVRF